MIRNDDDHTPGNRSKLSWIEPMVVGGFSDTDVPTIVVASFNNRVQGDNRPDNVIVSSPDGDKSVMDRLLGGTENSVASDC